MCEYSLPDGNEPNGNIRRWALDFHAWERSFGGGGEFLYFPPSSLDKHILSYNVHT
jgi:hypothetical protein